MQTSVSATTRHDSGGAQGYIPNLQVHSFANVSHGSAYNISGMGIIEPGSNGGTQQDRGERK